MEGEQEVKEGDKEPAEGIDGLLSDGADDGEVPEEFRVPEDADEVRVEKDGGGDKPSPSGQGKKDPEKPAVDDPFAALPEDVRTKIKELQEQSEKRVRDTQSQWQKDHQELVELRKSLEATKQQAEQQRDAAKVKASGDDPEVRKWYKDKWNEDPEVASWEHIEKRAAELKAEIKSIRDEYAKQAETMRMEIEAREIRRQEAESRQKHSDYDAVVTEFLVPEMQKDPSIERKWSEMGRTAEAAYTLGKQLRESQEFLRDPAKARERIKAEILAEIEKQSRTKGKTETLAGVAGRPPPKRQETSENDDILGEVISSRSSPLRE